MTARPLLVTTAPHIKKDEDIASIMRAVCYALLPALLFAWYRFGYWAITIALIAAASAVLTEWVCQKIRRVPVTIHDGSAVVTGLLLATVLPPNVAWYIPVIGSVVAIGIAKQCFGGLGANIWNPALIGRAFLQAAFPTQINSGSWPAVKGMTLVDALNTSLCGSFGELDARAAAAGGDVVTSATPLAQLAAAKASVAYDTATSASAAMKEIASSAAAWVVDGVLQISGQELWSVFLGNTFGCLGEVSALALLGGGLYLLARGIIRWHIPVAYIGTVALLGWMLPAPYNSGAAYTHWFAGPGLYHVVAGGVMIGAFFMATDMVTSPVTRKGQLIFGCGCGVITMCIRLYSTAYPEGVCYSILLMNTVAPLIDAWTRPRVFGTGRKETKA